jgi:hypothetical protein
MADLFKRVMGSGDAAGGSLFDRVMKEGAADEQIGAGFRSARDVALGLNAGSLSEAARTPQVDLSPGQRTMDARRAALTTTEDKQAGASFAREARAYGLHDSLDTIDFAQGRMSREEAADYIRRAKNLDSDQGFLGSIGQALYRAVPQTAAGVMGGAGTAVGLVNETPLGRLPGMKETEATLERGATKFGALGDALASNSGSFVKDSLLEGVTSIPLSVVALAMAATGNPEGGSILLGAVTGGDSANRGRQAGLSKLDAARYGVTDGVYETATEMLPALRYFKDVKVGTPFFRKLLNNFVTENIGEQAATALQDLNEWQMISSNRGKTFADYVLERPQAALATALAVAPMSAGSVSIEHGLGKAVGRGSVEGVDLTGKPGMDAAIVEAAQPTQADIASPLDTRDIVAGKATIAANTARATLDEAAKGAGLPTVGQRVEVQTPEGQPNLTGTLKEIFGSDDLDLPDTGLDIELDGGGRYREYLNDIRDAGHSVRPIGRGATPQAAGAGLKRLIRRSESSDNDHATNPNSSAKGPYQFLDSTWAALGGDPNKRFDAAENDRMMDKLLAQNSAALSKAGFEATDGTLYLAHVLGPQGAINALRNPNAAARDVLGDRVVNANSFMKDMTAGEVAQWAEKRVGGKEATPSALMVDENGMRHEADTGTDFLNVELNSNKVSGESADAGGPTPSPGDLGAGGSVSAPGSASVRVFHGGPGVVGDIRAPFYVTEDRELADHYAQDRGRGTAKVEEFDISPSKVADQTVINLAAHKVGVSAREIDQTPAGMLLDPEFQAKAPQIMDELRRLGFDVAKFEDFSPVDERKSSTAYAVLDPAAIRRAETRAGVAESGGARVAPEAERVSAATRPQVGDSYVSNTGVVSQITKIDGDTFEVETPGGKGKVSRNFFNSMVADGKLSLKEDSSNSHASEIASEAANVAAPTEAQKEAGNYRKGHVRVHGLDITIETPQGAERSGRRS